MKPSGIVHNTVALLAIQIANQLLPLVVVPHLTRALGLDAYGAYAFGLSIIAISCVVTDFGFNLWATAEVSKNQSDVAYVNHIYGAVMGAKMLLSAICFLGIFLYLGFSDFPSAQVAALYWTPLAIVGMTLQPVWLFNGLERMAYITAFVFISRIAFVIAAVLLVRRAADLDVLIMANGVSQLLAAWLGWIALRRFGFFPVRPALKDCHNVMVKSAPFFLSRVAVSTYTACGALFLGIFSSTRNVAIYSVAEQLYRGAQSLLSPLGQVMYPYMVRSGNFKVLAKAILGITVAAALGAGFTVLFGEHVVRILFGEQYMPALPVLHIFMLTIVVNSPSILLGYPALGALGKLHLANRSVMVAGLLQVLVLAILAIFNLTTAINVAIGVLLAETLVLVLRAMWTLQYRSNQLERREYSA